MKAQFSSSTRHQSPNHDTSPQIPGTNPQIPLQAPGPAAGRQSCPRPGSHFPDPDLRAPFQARSREHAARSKLPPPPAPRPLSPPQPMAAENWSPLTNGDAELAAAGYKNGGGALRPVPGWANPVAKLTLMAAAPLTHARCFTR